MKKLLFAIAAVASAAVSFALANDDETMVITHNNGKIHAIHTNEIEKITVSEYELSDKFYDLDADTVLVHDTIFEVLEVHDTIYLEKQDNPMEGLAAIDLALPSGTLWANMNLNASSPEELGGFYAWGETTQKYNFTSDSYSKPTNFGDAASEQSGSEWSMPTSEQFKELRDYCIWKQDTIGSQAGCLVTGTNGNSIFLPYSGIMYEREVYYKNYCIFITSSKRSTNNNGDCAYSFVARGSTIDYDFSHKIYDDDGSYGTFYSCVYYGYQIRPVKSR